MAELLIVHHSPSRSMRALTEAVVAGANDDEIENVQVTVSAALDTTADQVLVADGILLGTPANFGYMSGALKHFFDSTFLQIGGALGSDGSGDTSGDTAGEATSQSTKTPYGVYVHGRYDTTGAVRSVAAITGALPWRQAAETLELLGDVDDDALARAYELGGTLAALVMP
ncbi:MAG: flavodoxin family protein [Dermatophilus congolensis]|nr:flavodoxin family protein [Dermatophilus congolensis]